MRTASRRTRLRLDEVIQQLTQADAGQAVVPKAVSAP